MIFISGYPRTGTNLMRGIVCNDNETIPPLKECEYIKDIVYSYYRAKQRWYRYTHDYFDNLDKLKNTHKQMTDVFFNHLQDNFGSDKKIVLKKPLFCYYFPELDELYSNQCKFIVMLRDPRDTLSSLLKIKRQENIQAPKLLQEYLDCYYRCFTKMKNNDNLLIIRFEDLVFNTEDIMNQLRSFTNLELYINPLQDSWQSRRSGDSRYLSEYDGKPIDSSVVGNYQLTDNELYLINNNRKQLVE